MKIHFKAVLACLALILPTTGVYAEPDWPSKPIKLVVPYPAGGNTDIVGRQLAKQMQEELGQAIVVENRAGAATAIGTSYVARSKNDGYTLLLSAGTTFTINPHVQEDLPYELEDFIPVTPVASIPFAFVVRQDFPAENLQEFIDYAKEHPGEINNATNGMGTMVHLLGVVMAQGLDIDVSHIHYRGAAPAATDLMAGVVDSNIEALANAVPNIEAEKYRALAVLSEERLSLLPDVPTFTELGYPTIIGESWSGIYAPSGTSQDIILKLNESLKTILNSDEYKEKMRQLGNTAEYSSSQEFDAITKEQSQGWKTLIGDLNL